MTTNNLEILLQKLDPHDHDIASAALHRMTFAPGEVIIHSGQPAIKIYCIIRGIVKISLFAPDGRERIIRMAGNGDVLDYHTPLLGTTYSMYATACTDTEVYVLASGVFRDLVRSNVDLANHVIDLLARELLTITDGLHDLFQRSAPVRVAGALLDLLKKYEFDSDRGTIGINLTRVEFAKIVGTTTETASRMLSRFQRNGMIALTGTKIQILNQPALRMLAER